MPAHEVTVAAKGGGNGMSDEPTIVSYEWLGDSYQSIRDVWKAREESPLVAISGIFLSGPIARHWSDGNVDTVGMPRCIKMEDRS